MAKPVQAAILVLFLGTVAGPGLAQSVPVLEHVAGHPFSYPGDGSPATGLPVFDTRAIATNQAGILYFYDLHYNRVLKVGQDGKVVTVAGTGDVAFEGDGGAAVQAKLNYVSALAMDSSGNVYIGETIAPRVRKVNTLGVITTVAGTGESGTTGDGGRATAAQLTSISSLALDGSGNLFIYTRARIRKVDPQGTITTVAGTGQSGFSGDNGPAFQAQIASSGYLGADSSGNLYLAERARIRKVDTRGDIRTIAGTGNAGSSGDGGPALSAMISVAGMAVAEEGEILITQSSDSRLRLIDVTGTIQTVSGSGQCGFSGDGGPPQSVVFCAPRSIAMTPDGNNVFLHDMGNLRIRGGNAERVWTVVGGVTSSYLGDGGSAAAAGFVDPQQTVADKDGNIYVADKAAHRVRRISTDGEVQTIAGTGVPGHSGDGGAAASAQFLYPAALALDAAGNLVIADQGNRMIRQIDRTGVIRRIAGTGSFGHDGDGGPAINATFTTLNALSYDKSGNLYVGDGPYVRRIGGDGNITRIAGNGNQGFDKDNVPATQVAVVASGLATDSAGNLYIADYYGSRIRKVGLDGIITTVAGGGQADPGTDGPATSVALSYPMSVVIDSHDTLFFNDIWTGRIHKLLNGNISTVAGGGTAQPDPAMDGGLATRANLIMILGGIALDPAGNILYQMYDSLTINHVAFAQISREGTVNAASFGGGAVAPGELVTIFGDQIGPAELTPYVLDGNKFTSTVADTTIYFDGTASPILYVSSGQVSVAVPYGTAGKQITTLQIKYKDKMSNKVMLPVQAASPGIFTVLQSGQGQGAIQLWPDYSVNSASNPVKIGGVAMIYTTAGGEQGVDGLIMPSATAAPVARNGEDRRTERPGNLRRIVARTHLGPHAGERSCACRSCHRGCRSAERYRRRSRVSGWGHHGHQPVVRCVCGVWSQPGLSACLSWPFIGVKTFGIMELDQSFTGCRFAIGLRNAHDKSMRLALTVGYQVFVCENMAFLGDFQPVLAEHSKNLNFNFAQPNPTNGQRGSSPITE